MTGFSTNLIKKIQHVILQPPRHIHTISCHWHCPKQTKNSKSYQSSKRPMPVTWANYRPASLLGPLSKILKKIVQIRLTHYLESHDLITRQFGFTSGHSTTHHMSLLLDKVTNAFNNKKHSIILFCNLKKAFDPWNHAFLLKKTLQIRNKRHRNWMV
jgi:hypothetical protein